MGDIVNCFRKKDGAGSFLLLSFGNIVNPLRFLGEICNKSRLITSSKSLISEITENVNYMVKNLQFLV